MTYLPGLNRIRGNTSRALTRRARSNRGRMGKLPDPYARKRPVYKADVRWARQWARQLAEAAEARDAG